MTFKVRPLNEMIPIIMEAIEQDYGLPIHKELPATESPMIHKIKQQHKRIQQLETALHSIAANTCCGKCQEAALVARAALEKSDD
jgi:bacterioferritin-associated ferredoxin